MIQGEIQNFPLRDLMQWLALTRRTGQLDVMQDDHQRVFHFAGGNIAAASSSDLKAPNSYEQACEVLVSALTWRSGNFIFRDCPLSPAISAINLRLPVETLLLKVLAELEASRKDEMEFEPDEWSEEVQHSETFTLADALRLQIVDHLLNEDFRVPPMPHLVTRVLELTRDQNCSLRDLGDLVLTDQAVAAQILRCANSAVRGYQRTVSTLPDAVQRLGSDEVVNIVLVASLQAPRRGRDLFAIHKRRLWARSSTAAFLARAIAAQIGLDHNLGFLCGLLMDFGVTVLYSLIQDLLGQKTAPAQMPMQVIGEVVLDYHPRVGRVVGERWQLPQEVVDSMAYHHRIEEFTSDRPCVAVSTLADFLATFALGRPRADLEESLSIIPPERLTAHPAAQLIGLKTGGAAEVIVDLPRYLDQALEMVID